MLAQGTPLHVVSEVLGHTSIVIVLAGISPAMILLPPLAAAITAAVVLAGIATSDGLRAGTSTRTAVTTPLGNRNDPSSRDARTHHAINQPASTTCGTPA